MSKQGNVRPEAIGWRVGCELINDKITVIGDCKLFCGNTVEGLAGILLREAVAFSVVVIRGRL